MLGYFLITSGSTNSHAYASLFILNKGSTMIYLLVDVDDIIVTGDNDRAIEKFIQFLARQFSLKDLRPSLTFLELK